MKRKILLVILCLFLVGCDEEKETTVLESIGYSKKEILVLEKCNKCIEKAKEKYDKNIVNLIEAKNFLEDNLENYLEYIKNFSSSANETILLVNNSITDYYNISLKDIFNVKYYISDNLNRYVSYLKNNETYAAEKVVADVNTNLDYEFYTNTKETDMDKDTLILVNKYYYLPDGYEPADLRNIKSSCSKTTTGRLRSIAADAFEEMCDAAFLDGYSIISKSPYRSYQTQLNLYNNYSKIDGVKEADTYSARAGFSEHQTGLAVDVNMINSNFTKTEEYNWLKNNAYKYGFIERYPEGKEYITGYIFESWHYRYVGKKVADYIHKTGITFDEYYAYYIEKK